jgi:hypothetical protein
MVAAAPLPVADSVDAGFSATGDAESHAENARTASVS